MFCKNCGNELNDKAIICPKCGCAVTNIKQNTIRANAPQQVNAECEMQQGAYSAPKKSLICSILNIVTIAFISASLMLLFMTLIDPYIRTYYYNYDVDFYYDFDMFLVSFIFSVVAYLVATVSFVLGFFKNNRGSMITCISLFVIVNFLLVTTIYAIATW